MTCLLNCISDVKQRLDQNLLILNSEETEAILSGISLSACGDLSSHFKSFMKDLGVPLDSEFRFGKKTESVAKSSSGFYIRLMFKSDCCYIFCHLIVDILLLLDIRCKAQWVPAEGGFINE